MSDKTAYLIKSDDGKYTVIIDDIRISPTDIKPMKGNRLYVSFYHESYRHWGYAKEGEPFVAKRTRDYQYTGNCYTRNPRAELRFQKTVTRTIIRQMRRLR